MTSDAQSASLPTYNVTPSSHLGSPEYNVHKLQSDLNPTMNPAKTDHLSFEDSSYLIGKVFRDDEDELLYKVLSVYKYKGVTRATQPLQEDLYCRMVR